MRDAKQTSACPEDATLARAVSEGPDEFLAAHLRSCPRCEATLREHRAVGALASRIPFVPPSPERRQRLRASVLEATGPGRARRLPWGVILLGTGLAAAAVLLILLRLPTPPSAPLASAPAPASRAVIEAASGARFERLSGPPHEVVRLYEGTIRTTVPRATAGETVRIITGAGEVEVRGTVFDTTARGDRLVAVKVQRGRVVVRAPAPAGARPAEVALETGRRWELAEERPPSPAEVAPPPPPRQRPRAPALPKPDPAEEAFGEGLGLLRGANPAAAARAFDRAVRLAPLGTLAEDASYWRAVALNRAGSEGGDEALLAFLDRFPQSARAGEAAVMLGWRLHDRGDLRAAKLRFEAGLADPSARVRKSARAGLDALARKAVPTSSQGR